MNATCGARPPVTLRPLASEHGALYRRLYTDPVVMTHLGGPLTVREADACFRTLMSRPHPDRLLYVVHGAGAVCGLAAMLADPAPADTTELGILLPPRVCGRGVGDAVLIALLARAAAVSPGRRLRVQYSGANAAAGCLVRRHGFRQVPPLPLPGVRQDWCHGIRDCVGPDADGSHRRGERRV